MLDPKKLANGQEQYEEFIPAHLTRHNDCWRVQYDYRDNNGRLFSIVARTIEQARQRRKEWEAKND